MRVRSKEVGKSFTTLSSCVRCVQLALFAGRRSSDRAFLLLQNLLCARHLPHYLGTSSIYAVTLISRALRELGIADAQQRIPYTGKPQPSASMRCGRHLS